MNKIEYRRACRYAYKATSSLDKDLVHDAYILWYDKTGKDLFEESNRTIITIIKHLHYKNFQSSKFMWRGQVFNKDFNRLTSLEVLVENGEIKEDNRLFNMVTPESIFLSKEKFELLRKSLSDFDQITLKSMIDGYRLGEIQDIQHKSNPVITRSVKRIREKVSQLYH